MRPGPHGRASSKGRRTDRDGREDGELSRELDIAPSVIRNSKRFADAGATTAMQASEDVVPASQFARGVRQDPSAKIRELERALGRRRWSRDHARRPGGRKKSPSLRRESGR